MKPISLFDFYNHFSDEQTCEDYLTYIRWGENILCPRCSSPNPYKTNVGFKCSNNTCYFKFNARYKSVFSNSKLPLRTWFNFIFYQALNKKNTSSHQQAKNIGITQKTMWGMAHKLRSVLFQDENIVLDGIIEIDEAFLSKGNKWTRWGGISTRKAPIIGLIERGGGKLIVKTIEDRKRSTILNIINQYVNPGATIYTDGAPVYRILNKNYIHDFVDHSSHEYVKGEVHTNNIERVWRMLKSNIRHAHHSINEKHVQIYCDELVYRINMKHLTAGEVFDDLLKRCIK